MKKRKTLMEMLADLERECRELEQISGLAPGPNTIAYLDEKLFREMWLSEELGIPIRIQR